MTLRVRNTILYLAAMIVFGVAGVLLVLTPRLVSLFRTLALPERVFLLAKGFTDWRLYQTQLGVVLLSMVAPLFVSIFGFFGYLRYFRKITGPLIFFFFIFLSSLVFETVPIWTLLVRIGRLPLSWIVVLTRLHTFGLLFGALSLFTASLYTAGIKYQYQGAALLIILGIAGGISYLLPVDVTTMAGNFLATVGMAPTLTVILVFLLVGILLNFFKSSILNQSAGDMLYGMAVGLMMMGRWMLHSSPNLVILISGMVMLLVGSITYARRVFNAYLWY
jgi:hypothetical protein